jgi:ABC-type amino acid transport substrate-binding protein/serine phosphatase RsbU (regulator of sigma subunit)
LAFRFDGHTRNSFGKINRRSLFQKTATSSFQLFFGFLFLFLNLICQNAAAGKDRLSVVYCVDCVPFQFQDENGAPTGLMIDYWNLWSRKTGIDIKFSAAPWDNSLEMVGSGAVDAHAGLFFTEERDKFLDYGSAIRNTSTHVFFHHTVPATTDFRQLAAYRVGVIDKDYTEGYLKERVPGGHIVAYPDYESIIAAVKAGELRVFAADTPTGLYHLKKAGLLSDFTFISERPLYRNDWFTAVQEGNKATIDIINAGMAQISEAERQEIGRRWVGDIRRIDDKDTLIIGIDRHYPPFTFLNAQGHSVGLFVDLWRAWAEKTGKKIRFRPSSWAGGLDELRSGEVDIHSGLSYSTERAEWLAFTGQTYQTASRIYHRASATVPGDIGAFDKRILGAWAGTFQEAEVHRLYPNTTVRGFESSSAMVDALVRNEIDAVIQEDHVMDKILRDMGLSRDIVARPERLFVSTIHGGVLKGREMLRDEIDAGLDILTTKELADIEARWISDPAKRFFGRGVKDADLGLTHAERAWLNAHPIIRLGVDRGWAPFEFLDKDGVHQGLSAQFVERIEQILGVTLQPPVSLTWAETLEWARSGGLDLLSALAPTTEREEDFIFTLPYLAWPNVIAARTESGQITGLSSLAGKRVGAVEGYAIHDILVKEHPEIEIVTQGDISTGLKALSSGRIDAFIDSPAAIDHFTDTLNLPDLAVVAPTPYKLEVAFAVRKDWPELAAIFDKALAQIPLKERARLAEAAGVSTRVVFAKSTGSASKLLSSEETLILAIIIAGGVGVLILLGWAIRRQEKPVFQSIQGKSVLFLAGVFVLVGGVTIWVLGFIGDRVSAQLGSYIAERHVLWHKEKVLGAVQRELALAKQMAESEILHRWAVAETDRAAAADARNELQRYHDNFRARSYFVGLAKTKHFFYADKKVKTVTLDVVDTLSAKDDDDVWFFATMADKAPYNLNVDHNVQLGVTNLWVNYAMRQGSETRGVVGTGVRLTEFVTDFITQDAKGVSAMMIDEGGAIQAHVDPSKISHNVLGKNNGAETGVWSLLSSEADRRLLRQHMAEMKAGFRNAETFFVDIDGQRRLVAMAYLEPLKWYTLAVFDPGAMVGLQEMGTLAAVLGIALLITVIVFVFGQNILVLRPLGSLSEGASRMAGGDYNVRLPVTQRDEIGELTDTFNGMASTIADYTHNLETMVADRTRELSDKTKELSGAYSVIQESIQYASRIQRSVLPEVSDLRDAFADHLVIWQPKDVVGGDIYLHRQCGDGQLLALIDCTGHGVPGAFMAMIATGAFDQALIETPDGNPAALLQRVNQFVKIVLGQDSDGGESDDGFECGACLINTVAGEIIYAGARFELWCLENEQFTIIKGDKVGIGYRRTAPNVSFTNHIVPIESDTAFYMTSDGLVDQVGGNKHRAFGKRRLKNIILDYSRMNMAVQGVQILRAFEEYQHNEERRDDISLIGFKPKA